MDIYESNTECPTRTGKSSNATTCCIILFEKIQPILGTMYGIPHEVSRSNNSIKFTLELNSELIIFVAVTKSESDCMFYASLSP